jgi:hypothetical protein
VCVSLLREIFFELHLRKGNNEMDEKNKITPCVSEPAVAYSLQDDVNEIPDCLLSSVVKRSIEDVENGRVYTTKEVMDRLERQMGWK